ncbi:MAG: hypothetical protein JNM56_02915, partial [Planctomycetia bacterium]|nr:hypothetical protein [Planctomycetia bacterium]
MYTSRPAAFKFAAAVLALAAFAFSSERAQAFSPFTGCIGNGGNNIGNGGN